MHHKTSMPNQSARKSSPTAKRFAIVILAAGKGTRLKSKYPKVLHAIAGKPLLEHVIAAAIQVVPAEDVFAVIGHEAERVREAVQHTGTNFIYQREQRGTGHALMVARDALASYDGILVLSGDVPLIRAETIARLQDFHIAQRAAMTILTTVPANPFGYGRIVRQRSGRPEVVAIVEQKALTPKQQQSSEINAGIYAFQSGPLFVQLAKLTTNNAHHEYYLTDIAALLVRAKKKVVACVAENPEEVLGANTRAELAHLDALLRAEKAAALMASGVTIFRPETCAIDVDVQVGEDTIINSHVQLLGQTRIGADCIVHSFCVIRDAEIGDQVEVRPGCVIAESRVGKGAVLGPYAHLRPGSEIGEGAHVGNFVETKKTKLGRGSKANHLSYLGDAQIGENVNVGAGTITCNFDGVNKHTTIIEDGAFIGSDSTLVAPVRIGREAYVGAASCITGNVPAESLALGRAQQINKEGWVRKRRENRISAQKSK